VIEYKKQPSDESTKCENKSQLMSELKNIQRLPNEMRLQEDVQRKYDIGSEIPLSEKIGHEPYSPL